MVNVTVYFEENNELCAEVINELNALNQEVEINITKIEINSDFSFIQKYKGLVPVVLIGPYQLKAPLTKTDLLVAIKATQDRQKKLGNGDISYIERVKRGRVITSTDRFTIWLSRYYLILINVILFLYVGLPFAAPVLMKNNLEGPAKIIYTIYSPVCHQLAYRSWFLFGEQAYYPRALANIKDVKTYEEVSGNQPSDLLKGREFLGNQELGFKVAFCERDIAIYASMLLFGLVFMMSGRRIKSIPWYAWVIVGMLPMGFDGGSQLFGFTQGFFPSWVPIRESTPLLRSITGALFGITTLWYVLPIIEELMIEGRSFVLRKMSIVKNSGDVES